ncbi:SICA antigen [Plasmodium coatneyi]|uniref:SICA antigen n=1 Tax=Plasmodium coatneyi TaxID=208452 RepID=A0A1B1DUN2_9APIC|nr:SICA antigen [Plasmodium coatneyi]ANQ06285.1 SICA antigen [Plasmodium coatneyi]
MKERSEGLGYFALPGKRKRYRRAHQVRRPSILQEQLLAHVDDQDDGPHEYTLVKERKQPRSAPTKRRKRERLDRRVGRRMIIDIHLEVLDECQKGDNKLNQEDFFEILVQEFMAREFMNEENVPKEDVPKEKDVQSLDSGFREEDFVPKEGIPQEQVPSSDSGFREENLVPKEDFTRKDVHKEQVPSSDCGCREEDFLCKKNVPNKGVPCSDSGFGF